MGFLYQEYDYKNRILILDKFYFLTPTSTEINETGTCISCTMGLESLSYHELTKSDGSSYNIIVARCVSCSLIFSIWHDSLWDWIEDYQIDEFFEYVKSKGIEEYDEKQKVSIKKIDEISKKRLYFVFSPKELEALQAKSKGEKYIRQNLYRARQKYSLFEELFGIKILI